MRRFALFLTPLLVLASLLALGQSLDPGISGSILVDGVTSTGANTADHFVATTTGANYSFDCRAETSASGACLTVGPNSRAVGNVDAGLFFSLIQGVSSVPGGFVFRTPAAGESGASSSYPDAGFVSPYQDNQVDLGGDGTDPVGCSSGALYRTVCSYRAVFGNVLSSGLVTAAGLQGNGSLTVGTDAGIGNNLGVFGSLAVSKNATVNGDAGIVGNVSIGTVLTLDAGTVGAPTLVVGASPTTGLYAPASDELGWSILGVRKLRLSLTKIYGDTDSSYIDLGNSIGASINYSTHGSLICDGNGVHATADTFKINTLTPLVFHNTALAQQAVERGSQALTAGAATITFGTAYSAAPTCFCADTGVTVLGCTTSGATTTQVVLNGTGTDTINWLCVGAK